MGQLLGNERHEGMQQSENPEQRIVQHRQRGFPGFAAPAPRPPFAGRAKAVSLPYVMPLLYRPGSLFSIFLRSFSPSPSLFRFRPAAGRQTKSRGQRGASTASPAPWFVLYLVLYFSEYLPFLPFLSSCFYFYFVVQ